MKIAAPVVFCTVNRKEPIMRLLASWMMALALALSAGCKETADSEDKGMDEPESGIPDIPPYMVTDEGIFIYWESELDPDFTMTLDRDLIDQWWIEVQQCLGLEAEPPIVRIADQVSDICPGAKDGGLGALCISLEPDPIVLNASTTASQPVWDTAEDRLVWKHEFIHYVGEENGKVEFREHDGISDPAPHWQCQWN